MLCIVNVRDDMIEDSAELKGVYAGGVMFVVPSGMLVTLLAFIRYSYFEGLTHGRLNRRGWSFGSAISLAPACIAVRLMRVW